MAMRSSIPATPGMDDELRRYLEKLDRRLPARADLTGSETAAQIATILNTLFSDLRAAGLMERS